MKDATRATHVGRRPFENHGAVNPPVYHASTIVYPTVAAMEEADRTPFEGTRYGRRRQADYFVRNLLGVEPRSKP